MPLGDRAALESAFERALHTLWMAYQPIVDWPGRRAFAYEAFVRSYAPALPTPADLFRAAERLDRLPEIGRAIRARVAAELGQAPGDAKVFVNLHPCDLDDDALFGSRNPLASVADRIVLEITERASLEDIREGSLRLAALRRMGFKLAVDDLGAGYAGLSAFARLEPDVVKLDMSLVRGIPEAPTKQRVVRSMRELCGELGMLVVVEGVETPEERDVLAGLGCQLQQGYLFARPAAGFPPARF
jgi:EAL domain-containing protein (putative c-di-GMP-specific phosphodiesterase class I)